MGRKTAVYHKTLEHPSLWHKCVCVRNQRLRRLHLFRGRGEEYDFSSVFSFCGSRRVYVCACTFSRHFSSCRAPKTFAWRPSSLRGHFSGVIFPHFASTSFHAAQRDSFGAALLRKWKKYIKQNLLHIPASRFLYTTSIHGFMKTHSRRATK